MLLQEFINAGFKALTVSVHEEKLSEKWLGRELNREFYEEIILLSQIDPCAENGEYHSFVYDGPIFSHPLQFSKGNPYKKDSHFFLPLI